MNQEQKDAPQTTINTRTNDGDHDEHQSERTYCGYLSVVIGLLLTCEIVFVVNNIYIDVAYLDQITQITVPFQ